MTDKYHYYLVLVLVYFVDGSVVACSYAPIVRGMQGFSSFPRVSCKFSKCLFDSCLVCVVEFSQSLRRISLQQNPENQAA